MTPVALAIVAAILLTGHPAVPDTPGPVAAPSSVPTEVRAILAADALGSVHRNASGAGGTDMRDWTALTVDRVGPAQRVWVLRREWLAGATGIDPIRPTDLWVAPLYSSGRGVGLIGVRDDDGVTRLGNWVADRELATALGGLGSGRLVLRGDYDHAYSVDGATIRSLRAGPLSAPRFLESARPLISSAGRDAG